MNREQTRRAIMEQNQLKQLRQVNEAQRLKYESTKNGMIIRRQKEQEVMKNSSIKEMIRKQKLDAEDRKEMVSYTITSIFHI